MIELIVILAFVLPLCAWQFYDISKAQKESARKREELARKLEEEEQKNSAAVPTDAP